MHKKNIAAKILAVLESPSVPTLRQLAIRVGFSVTPRPERGCYSRGSRERGRLGKPMPGAFSRAIRHLVSMGDIVLVEPEASDATLPEADRQKVYLSARAPNNRRTLFAPAQRGAGLTTHVDPSVVDPRFTKPRAGHAPRGSEQEPETVEIEVPESLLGAFAMKTRRQESEIRGALIQE